MENLTETITEIKKHLKKLIFVIDNESTFTFADIKIHKKARMDDVICCVEANFPNEYKKLIRLPQHKDYKSIAMYYSIKSLIQRKCFFSSSSYMVQYKTAIAYINNFSKVLEQDLKKLANSSMEQN